MIMRVESGEHIHLGGYNEMYNVFEEDIQICIMLTVHAPGNLPGFTLLQLIFRTVLLNSTFSEFSHEINP